MCFIFFKLNCILAEMMHLKKGAKMFLASMCTDYGSYYFCLFHALVEAKQNIVFEGECLILKDFSRKIYKNCAFFF